MRPRLVRLWSFGPLLVVACADEPPDISGDIENYAVLLTEARSSLCDCPQLVGYPDSIQCDEGWDR